MKEIWKKHHKKIIAGAAVVAVLAFAFWFGGNAPGLRGWSAGTEAGSGQIAQGDQQSAADPNSQDEPTQPDDPQITPPTGTEEAPPADSGDAEGGGSGGTGSSGMTINPSTGKDKYQTDPVPEGKPVPVEPENNTVTDKKLTCTLSVSCATILNNLDWLDPEKKELIPEDGWVLKPVTVEFYEGESVFNVLQRTMKQNKIQMEFSTTPMYNSAYIEGIANLYEFDCGERSGWMYSVNSWFPNYGCSRYALQDGDVISWVYTCDLGQDVGGGQVVQDDSTSG